ncbi:hypothetical protein [Mucilaginibacter xinganensis]|uniref:Uncharacterized protein n=1 Tax=Mucilaginibacter xinganensis TaxID=1234841 RepID=A0A223P0Q4_9SPHI|nr:hypothetical protein [Mucilaginibacter xinganensis]ASU35421.1 hypothetical protein MuYL_3536 [Mucilaginibacter xinganensis]
MASFFSKFNIKLLVIHFIALWFFIYAFQTLAYLYDFNFLIFLPVEARINDVPRVNFDMKLVAQAGLVGAIAGYIISWRISLKRNWFWLNSVLIFVLIYVLKLYDLLGWSKLQKVFLLPGQIFRLNTRTFYVTNGLIMLAIGCCLLFSERIKDFIDGKRNVTGKGKNIGKIKSAKR